MTSFHCLQISFFRFQLHLPYKWYRTSWNKTQNSVKEHQCLPITSWSYWNSVYATPTSCSKANSMSRQRGQLWDLQWVANLYMEYFEYRVLASAVNPPRLWKRYVDDTFVILQQTQKEEFLQHINSADPSIKFFIEEPRQDGSMPIPGYTDDTTRRWKLNNLCL